MTLRVYKPYDRSLLAELPADSGEDLRRKLDRATHYFADRRRWVPTHERIAMLRRAADVLEGQRESFAERIADEGGKPLTDALVEATRAVDGIRNAVDALRTFAGEEIPMGLTAASTDRFAFTTREPIGVVAAISAFNHPLNLIVHQAIPAIATGCPVLVKPASSTPLSCLALVKLLHEAGVPPALCDTVLPEDDTGAEQLATSAQVAFLSFIGSARVGWHLRGKLAPGTRCALEHGGAAPCIVHHDADLDAVLGPIVKAAYYHAGQVCVSTQRIFVHASIRDDFLARLSALVAALRVGDPGARSTDVGPLISPREVERVTTWVDEARALGAGLSTGGVRLGETTYAPTVLVEPPYEARVSREEVFGPVASVYTYTDVDRAIAAANALPFAFQASVFTRDLGLALHVARMLDAASVLINDHTAFRVDWMPFGGRKQSGYGVGGIGYTMHDMTQHKLIVLRQG
jgi:acyl-CoA reductase-like NAD-dependent aldehyde dehydrogenase